LTAVLEEAGGRGVALVRQIIGFFVQAQDLSMPEREFLGDYGLAFFHGRPDLRVGGAGVFEDFVHHSFGLGHMGPALLV